MSRPSDRFGRRDPSGSEASRSRRPDSGIARGPGLLVAAVTAGIVFVIGQQLFPIKPKQPPQPPAPPPIAAPEPPPPPPVAATDAASQAAGPAGDAGATAATAPETPPSVAAADAGKAAVAEKEPAADPTKPPGEEPPSGEESPPVSPERKAADKQKQADKDLAREAWRRNRPDISVVGTKTSILVPIRGSIRGADFKIHRRTRTVVVTLPKAVSMVTMRVYNLKHPSFKKLWIDQDEANAQPRDGSKLRVIMAQTYDPQVEITDDFVRVTIRRPEAAGDDKDGESRREKRREKHGESQPEKSSDKRGDASDEPAAPEKEKD